MIYVFDSCAFITLFRHFYRKRFPSLWKSFDGLVAEGRLLSTREVNREIGRMSTEVSEWANANTSLFHTPTADEAIFVAEIFKVSHFQSLVEQKKRYEGGLVADPFVVAKAKIIGGGIVTTEGYTADGKVKPHSGKIPHVCEYFSIPCFNLENFMEQEGWEF